MQMLSKLANLKKHRSRACLGARKPLIKRQKLKEPQNVFIRSRVVFLEKI